MEKPGFMKTLKNRIRTPFFSDEDLKLVFNNWSRTSIHSSLSYHLKNRHILKLKRGVYCLASDDGKFNFSMFSLANHLYVPSYVSFESALSYYGLIPEGVHEISSACFRAKYKKFKTPAGVFSYRYIPANPFFLETEQNEQGRFIIATPLRALFDLIYSRRRFYHSLDGLEDDFRIEVNSLREYLKKYRASEILEMGEYYKKRTTRNLAELLSGVIK